MININYEETREELIRKNLYDIQKDLTVKRRNRTAIMSLLVAALVLTLVYGMLENPFIYTLSNIGNFFTYRYIFIIWSIITGGTIQIAAIILFKLEKYKTKYGYFLIGLSAIFLVLTAILPALKDEFPFFHILHTFTSGLHALFLFLALIPFSIWISQENPRLRLNIYIWTAVIYAGSIVMLVLFQHSALFELWFFISNILYLLYLCMNLFEEAIIKKSVMLLMNEDDLNIAIERLFVNLDKETKRQEEHKAKEEKKKNSQIKTKQ
ncbi:MAG: DUF998 domain-containing protein [Tenericutes bacterium]|nr:DUF998 domain-containing protein [Mycoplasmatota bacterium]